MSEETKQTEALAKPAKEPLAFIPKNLDEAWRVADLLSKAAIIPDALKGKPHDVLIIVMTGTELGLSPMQSLRNIDVVKGKPFLESLLRVAMVKQDPSCEYFRMVESTRLKAVFETKRSGEGVTRMEYTVEDARDAGALPANSGSNWAKDPALMLRRRCAGRLADEVYPDVVRGVGDRSEVVDEPRDVNPRPATFAPPKPVATDAEVVPPSPPAAKGKKRPVIADTPKALDPAWESAVNALDDRAALEAAEREGAAPVATPPKPEAGALDAIGILMKLADAKTEADIDALAPMAVKIQGPERTKLSAAFKARRLEMAKDFVQGEAVPS